MSASESAKVTIELHETCSDAISINAQPSSDTNTSNSVPEVENNADLSLNTQSQPSEQTGTKTIKYPRFVLVPNEAKFCFIVMAGVWITCALFYVCVAHPLKMMPKLENYIKDTDHLKFAHTEPWTDLLMMVMSFAITVKFKNSLIRFAINCIDLIFLTQLL